MTLSSKRDGLDKAVHRIEQALKKSKTYGTQSADGQQTMHLQNLLNEAQDILPNPVSSSPISQRNVESAQKQHHVPPIQNGSISATPRAQIPGQNTSDENDNYAVDDAENPLQLLARASDLSVPSGGAPSSASVLSTVTLPPIVEFRRDHNQRTFFGPFRPRLDIGEEIDPIDMGLVTIEEANILFN